jgi:hypothetical protein
MLEGVAVELVDQGHLEEQQVQVVVLLEQHVVQEETMLQQIQVVELAVQEILPHLRQVMVVQE